MCLHRDMSVSKITPKFLTELTGFKNLLLIEIEDEDTLEHCIGVPILIYSVLDGLRHRRLLVNEVSTRSSVEESSERGEWDLVGGNEIKSWVSLAYIKKIPEFCSICESGEVQS